MFRFIVLALLFSAFAQARDAADYTDAELIAAGWTQEQIDILKGRVQEPRPEKEKRTNILARDFEQANRNCVDESVQVLGVDRTNEDTMSYWIACVESFGFSNAREVAMESNLSPYVTRNNVHAKTGKPFSMLVRERRNFEYAYCTEPLMRLKVITDFDVAEAAACFRDFLWFEDQIHLFESEFSR